MAKLLVFSACEKIRLGVLSSVTNLFLPFQDSESVYCGHLHLISDLLQAMFKEAYSLQKQLMELFDLISISSASSEEDITCMVSGICGFDTF